VLQIASRSLYLSPNRISAQSNPPPRHLQSLNSRSSLPQIVPVTPPTNCRSFSISKKKLNQCLQSDFQYYIRILLGPGPLAGIGSAVEVGVVVPRSLFFILLPKVSLRLLVSEEKQLKINASADRSGAHMATLRAGAQSTEAQNRELKPSEQRPAQQFLCYL
jgi:hypothetical protein